MKDVINFLKAAVLRGPAAGPMGCYIFDGNVVYTRNHGMAAAIPFESENPFLVPSEELESAVARMKKDPELGFTGDQLTLKAGRLKSTISIITDVEPPSLPNIPESWIPAPQGLADALKIAYPFLGDQGWMSGAELRNDKLTVFNSKSGIVITLPGMDLETVLLSKECIEFLIAQGSPGEYYQEPGAMNFRWSDGRWMHAQVLQYEMPSSIISTLFENAGIEVPISIDDEWRDALGDSAALTETIVEISSTGFHGGKGAGLVDVDMEIPLENPTYWKADSLVPVFAAATAWNPANHPGVALFTGKNLMGVVQGVRSKF